MFAFAAVSYSKGAAQAAERCDVESLVAQLSEKDPKVNRSAVDGLRACGPAAVPALLSKVEGEPLGETSAAAATVLAKLSPELDEKQRASLLDALKPGLEDSVPHKLHALYVEAQKWIEADPCLSMQSESAPEISVADTGRREFALLCAQKLARTANDAETEWRKTDKSAEAQVVSGFPVVIGGHAWSSAQPADPIRDLHHAYRNLRTWYVRFGGEKNAEGVEKLKEQVHSVMEAVGLRTRIMAEFVTGFVRTNVSEPASGEGPADATKPSGHISWSTRHFGFDTEEHKGLRLDLSFGGRLGFLPVQTLITKKSADAKAAGTAGLAAEAAQLDYQEAFVWDAGFDGHIHSGRFESAALLRAGQSVLNSDSVLVKGDQPFIAVPLAGTHARWFWEAGLAIKYHFQSLEVLHEQNGLVQPALEVSGGFKHDNQFQDEGGKVVFADPTRRWFLRFVINGIPVRNVPVEEKDKPRLFTIGFGLEYERGGSGAPSGTRFLIKGRIELLKALRGDH